MKRQLTRRRFGQMVIASTAAAGLGHLATKTFAQTILSVYGAHPVPKAGKIFVQSLNVTTGAVQELTTATIQIGEKLIGFTSLANAERTLVLAIGPVRAGKQENTLTRLVFLGTSPRILTLSGLTKQEALESVLGTNDGSLIGLVIKKNIRPPVKLVAIDIITGQISLIDKIKLPQSERFSNLAQCPNGTIYTTVVGRLGETNLVQLDLGQGKLIPRVRLKFNDEEGDSEAGDPHLHGFNSGLSSLVCSSPAGQLLALGKPSLVTTPNRLYSVDEKTGAMSVRLREFDVSKITIRRA